MSGIIHFETFLITGLLLNLTPGNDTIYILSRSIAGGKKAGVLSALGISTGSLIHTTLAAFGLSVIIAKSILIFNIIKYAGAAYILFLGIKMLIDTSPLSFNSSDPLPAPSLKKIYRDAVITNILNPKVAMFFIAFLPQFIDTASRNSAVPFLALGITFTITGTIWCLVIANFSAIIFLRLRNNQKFKTYVNRTCGLVLIALGIKVAFTHRK